jgi:hypothetical protein
MANDNNRQDIRINGNVVGNNNTVSSRREEHHHHHPHGGSSKSGSGGDDVAGAGFGMLFAVLVVCWFFVRHAPEIYFYIKLGALVSAVPLLGVVAFAFSENAPDNRQITATIFGFALSVATYLLAQYGQDRLDPQLLQFGQQARDAWTFWKGLTEYGHNLVVGNLAGAICLGATAFFSLLMGISILWHFVSDADVEDSFLLRLLNPFRPSRGGILAGLAILVAWAFETGFVFEVLKPAAGQ